MISKTVLAKGLDAGTAFEILSIDIAHVDVGKNIGAELGAGRRDALAEEEPADHTALRRYGRFSVGRCRSGIRSIG